MSEEKTKKSLDEELEAVSGGTGTHADPVPGRELIYEKDGVYEYCSVCGSHTLGKYRKYQNWLTMDSGVKIPLGTDFLFTCGTCGFTKPMTGLPISTP